MKQKTEITNKKAFHDYFVEDTLEVGINLIGCEVKSIRQGACNLTDSFCRIENGQLLLVNCYVKNYDKGSFSNTESRRTRRLLAHKTEILRLRAKSVEKGFTLVPLKIYFSGSLVKVQFGLCKGKKLYDKKRSIMEKDVARDVQKEIKRYEERR